MRTNFQQIFLAAIICSAFPLLAVPFKGSAEGYQIFVSNEKSGDLTVINGADFKVTATIPVGKRPRGIQVSPNGKTIYVALSGRPIEVPRKVEAEANSAPIAREDDAA